jgi:hypothetical protein
MPAGMKMPETHEMPGAIGRGFQMTRHEQKKQERATTTFACDVISIGPFTVSSIVGTVLTRAATSRPAKLRKLPRISRESCSATRACASWQLQLRCRVLTHLRVSIWKQEMSNYLYIRILQLSRSVGPDLNSMRPLLLYVRRAPRERRTPSRIGRSETNPNQYEFE